MATVPAVTVTVFKPIIHFGRCFRLAPYFVTGETGSRLLQSSFDAILYSIVFIAVSAFLVMYYSSIWNITNVVSVCSASEKLIALSVILQLVLSAFVCLLKRHTIMNIANQLAGLNASLSRVFGRRSALSSCLISLSASWVSPVAFYQTCFLSCKVQIVCHLQPSTPWLLPAFLLNFKSLIS